MKYEYNKRAGSFLNLYTNNGYIIQLKMM